MANENGNITIRQERYPEGRAIGGTHRTEVRVIQWPKAKAMPVNCVKVPDDTELHDWRDANWKPAEEDAP